MAKWVNRGERNGRVAHDRARGLGKRVTNSFSIGYDPKNGSFFRGLSQTQSKRLESF